MSSNIITPQPPAHKGLFSALLRLPGQIIATLIMALLFRLFAEWTGMTYFWPDQGAAHARQIFIQELGWFSDNITHSMIVTNPAARLEQMLVRAWQWCVNTGLMTGQTRQYYHAFPPGVHEGFGVSDYIQATAYTLMALILRAFLLVLTLPLFILTALVGVIDGLVRRDIRRFGSGYESGFIYHHARRTLRPFMLLPGFVYLSLPFIVHPALILLPSALVLGMLVSVTVGSFKKYI